MKQTLYASGEGETEKDGERGKKGEERGREKKGEGRTEKETVQIPASYMYVNIRLPK